MEVAEKIPVAILGATGAVGQRFVQLLAGHPWFKLVSVAASETKVGSRYGDVCQWRLTGPIPEGADDLVVTPLTGDTNAKIVFSALPADIAIQIEPLMAMRGHNVCSNASAHRYDIDIPLVIPDVNPEHMELIDLQKKQRGWSGLIVTSPNCTTSGMVIPLKPLDDAFNVSRIIAASMQAISGTGYPGIPAMDIFDNVIPYIGGEEHKMAEETKIILGSLQDGVRIDSDVVVSAHANRVAVIDGHTICLSMEFESPPKLEDAIEVLRDYQGKKYVQDLPSSPSSPIVVRHEKDRPQPRLDRQADSGMAVSVGRIRSCEVLDMKMVSVSHNTLRGAASGSIFNAELLVYQGYITS